MIFDIIGVEEKIGYAFKDKMLLRKCFTHSSYANENGTDDNELLEFFGDSVIEFIVTEYLFKQSKGDEGMLTKKRASLVSKAPLLYVIKEMDIGKYMLLGIGQESYSSKTEKFYSSLYEALVAGIYLDGGMAEAKKFIKNTLLKAFEEGKFGTEQKGTAEAKCKFQEYVQKNKLGSVGYEVLSKKGPDNLPQFRVAALLNGKRISEGKGYSKKSAEADAAERALSALKKQGGK